jgi:hypothetical protein
VNNLHHHHTSNRGVQKSGGTFHEVSKVSARRIGTIGINKVGLKRRAEKSERKGSVEKEEERRKEEEERRVKRKREYVPPNCKLIKALGF